MWTRSCALLTGLGHVDKKKESSKKKRAVKRQTISDCKMMIGTHLREVSLDNLHEDSSRGRQDAK